MLFEIFNIQFAIINVEGEQQTGCMSSKLYPHRLAN